MKLIRKCALADGRTVELWEERIDGNGLHTWSVRMHKRGEHNAHLMAASNRFRWAEELFYELCTATVYD